MAITGRTLFSFAHREWNVFVLSPENVWNGRSRLMFKLAVKVDGQV